MPVIRHSPIALAIFGLASMAQAQSDAPAANNSNSAKVQDVVVTTGARGEARAVADSLSPIDVISADTLASVGKQNLREALEALAPSYTETAGFKGQIGLAVSTATLRGLGGTNVLVLVNGKRRHISAAIISGLGPAGTDLDLIPVSAIERIEILRDGAAAQYGSDAIAGVINVILKRNSSGGSGAVLAGRYMSTVGDQGLYGQTGDLFLNQGLSLGSDGGFASLSLSYVHQDATNVAGAVPQGSEPGARKIYFPVNGADDPRETSKSRFRQILGRPRQQTLNIAYNAELPVTQDLTLYSFSTGSERHANGWGTFRTANAQQNIVSVYPDGFLPKFIVNDTDYQSTFGIKGTKLAGWDWDLSTSYAHDDANSHNNDTINPTLGPTSPHDFDLGHLIYNEWTSNLDVTRKVATGLFDKPLIVSAGTEYRRTVFKQTPGQPESYADGPYVYPPDSPLAGIKPNPGAAGFAGYSPDVSGVYARTNKSVYVDLSQSLTKNWDISGAVRYEKYSDVGSTTSGKLSTRYQLTEQLAVRGTINNGFSAPTLQQKYFTNVLGGYATNAITGVVSQSFSRSVPAYDPAAKALGAQPLTPERSNNVSLGLVYKPGADTTISADAYQIDIRDRILLSNTLQAVQVGKVLTAAGLSANQSVTFYLNAGDTQTRGLDIVVDHVTRLQEYGRIKWTLLANHIKTDVDRLVADPAQLTGTGATLLGRSITGRLTDAYPKNTVSGSANWTFGDWDTTVKVTHYSGVIGRNAVAANRDEYVKPAFIADASVGYWVKSNLKVTVGANNLFNKRPEQLNDEAVKYYSFPVGRPNYSWFSPYGVDGGYYYARADITW